ncbi:hypothetical protein SPHS6_00161 [Sphingobium sp. S6]|nr:hypothetical protein SPHS8_00161 [Sphingobium sp. S8]CAD7334770.1 hypothetical protein SPHS6_00161 [Sphingobium sp. S6]
MDFRSGEGWDGPRLPRLRHWLAAAAALFVLTQVIPVIAGFI